MRECALDGKVIPSPGEPKLLFYDFTGAKL